MTKKELIETLNDPAKQIGDDAVIMAFDFDAGRPLPITGLIYSSSEVELCTDSQQE